MLNKRLVLFGLVLVLLLPAVSLVQAQATTITIAGWSSNPAEDAALQARLDEFNAANPDIMVEFVPSTDHTVTMQTAFAAGDYPQVFYIDSSRLPDWASAGVVAIGEDAIENQDEFYPCAAGCFPLLRTIFTARRRISPRWRFSITKTSSMRLGWITRPLSGHGMICGRRLKP
ncbi:extracellular solute-binding protein [bacterium]|nr:extracellular solute-binding protein [bacterium]